LTYAAKALQCSINVVFLQKSTLLPLKL